MSALPASALPPPRRARLLQALGITPWALRTQAPTADAPAGATAEPASIPPAAGHCVVVLPAGCAPRELDLLGRALLAGGGELARAARIGVADGRPVAPLPAAPAYLVFGQAQAHALGRELPAAVMNQAQIVLVDEPAAVLGQGAGKRRLWTAVRQLRRALRGG
ncbi:hypothetical protein [Frateuria defendens]|uniref:hypothetical protein n=1 Tax=Frateuria defendens TaxID=2219559 RepID=UPI00066FB787|nr:hypothetical protein [Frateuria defendens]